jgi:hypothetical protein
MYPDVTQCPPTPLCSSYKGMASPQIKSPTVLFDWKDEERNVEDCCFIEAGTHAVRTSRDGRPEAIAVGWSYDWPYQKHSEWPWVRFSETETGCELFFHADHCCDAAPFETSTVSDAAAGRRLKLFLLRSQIPTKENLNCIQLLDLYLDFGRERQRGREVARGYNDNSSNACRRSLDRRQRGLPFVRFCFFCGGEFRRWTEITAKILGIARL